MNRVLVIANLTAGAGAGRINKRRLLEVAQRDLERDFQVEVAAVDSSAAVIELARVSATSDFHAIVAAGGDGTINAVVNGMMRAGLDSATTLPPLGVLPMGTGNVFAFNMDIPRSWRDACRTIRTGNVRTIDVGVATAGDETRHFLLMAGVGFDAKVVEDTSLRLKYVLRDFAYVLKTLQNVVLHQGARVTLRFVEGRVHREEAWLVMIGNAASYAWDIKVTQHARVDDGVLDVCLMPFENKIVSIQQAMQILTGQHIERGTARYWQTRSLRIESEPSVPVQLDGDEWARTPLEIRVLPAAIRVLAPPETDV
jgi:YegS/Rv2252/BmrU family lipid kinase